MSEKYLEMPWSIEDTIEHLEVIKKYLQKCVILSNHDGMGKKDAEEVAFDFNRAIKALKKQIPVKTDIRANDDDVRIGRVVFTKGTKVHYCPECHKPVTGSDHYCRNCGQALIWK